MILAHSTPEYEIHIVPDYINNQIHIHHSDIIANTSTQVGSYSEGKWINISMSNFGEFYSLIKSHPGIMEHIKLYSLKMGNKDKTRTNLNINRC